MVSTRFNQRLAEQLASIALLLLHGDDLALEGPENQAVPGPLAEKGAIFYVHAIVHFSAIAFRPSF